jgi:hypothetical protein
LPADAHVYVVSQATPGAADTNAGSERSPFQTIQHAVRRVKPGDTVLVLPGHYDERVRVNSSGAPGKLITLRAMPRRAAVVGGFDVEASFIRIEGFAITAPKPPTAVQLGGSHCEVIANHIDRMMAGVAGTGGQSSPDGKTRDYSNVAHNYIAYNQVECCQYGFVLGGEDWLVENNEVNRLIMYTPGNRFDDCDYSRFFGKRCVQRYNYYHGSTSSEIRTAHVDCLQTFTNNGELAEDLVFESNTCFDFHQMCMVESAPHLGSVRRWTIRGNIVSASSPTMRGGWGPDIIQTQDVTIANNTIVGVRWAAIGLRGKESTGGQIRNNILGSAARAVIDGDSDFSASHPQIEYNLTFTDWPAQGLGNIHVHDPLFVDATRRNFRLRKGSPAIGAGKDGATIGALTYPNVYFVDPRHPAAADEPGWGYPAVPLASLARACALAQPGETVVLRGGVYRETLRPQTSGVTFRAKDGEHVTLSGADLIEGWSRGPAGTWSAAVSSRPRRLLRDGQPWTDFTYDGEGKRIVIKDKDGDPRLHRFETIVRERGIDPADTKDVRI